METLVMKKLVRPRTVHARWMIRRDLAQVAALEAAAGGTWTEAEFDAAMRHRSVIGKVAEVTVGRGRARRDVIVGFAVYLLRRDAVQVTNLRFTHPAAGAALAEKLVNKTAGHRRPCLLLPLALAAPLGAAVLCPEDDPGLGLVFLTGIAAGRWLTGTVRLLVKAGAEPDIVADALEDADCDDRLLLGVLRRGGSVAALAARSLL